MGTVWVGAGEPLSVMYSCPCGTASDNPTACPECGRPRDGGTDTRRRWTPPLPYEHEIRSTLVALPMARRRAAARRGLEWASRAWGMAGTRDRQQWLTLTNYLAGAVDVLGPQRVRR